MTTGGQFPSRERLNICFAHVAYQMGERFKLRSTGLTYFETRSVDETLARMHDADVLVVSGFWRNELLKRAGRLRFIQSIGAGTDQFPKDELRSRGIRLASAVGVNLNAVSEHAMAHVLAFARHIHTGRDNQKKHLWRGMISDLSKREDELGGKTMLIFGLGSIGSRTARLAKAFDMKVIGVKRDISNSKAEVDELHTPDKLLELLPRADFVVLTCPLTPETEKVINACALAAMKPSAYLINMARGRCVDEPALVEALRSGNIAGAGIDHFWDEPLGADSPFWDMENVLITPHTGGETTRYEDNVIDILLDNLDRLWSGNPSLRNQVV